MIRNLILIMLIILILPGCGLFSTQREEKDEVIEVLDQNEIVNFDSDIITSTPESIIPEEIISSSSGGNLTKDDVDKVINLQAEVDSVHDYSLLALAKKNNITTEDDEIPPNMDPNLVLEIKMLSILRSINFLPKGDIAYLETMKGITGWDIHKDVVFFYKPFEMQYFMYPDVDAKTFESLGPIGTPITGIYFKDKNYLYRSKDGILKKMSSIDISSFEYHYLYGATYQEIVYATDKNGVYFFGPNGELVQLSGADPKTFEEIDYTFFRDKQYVWVYDIDNYDFITIEGADPTTFEKNQFMQGAYFSDKNTAYYYDREFNTFKKIEGLDFDKFEKVFGTVLQNDSGLYYFSSFTTPSLVKISDNSNLEEIENGLFYKIDDSLFFYNPYKLNLQKLNFIDPNFFKVLSTSYNHILVADNKGIYILNDEYDIMPINNLFEIDMNSFEFIDDPYGVYVAKDKDYVYVGRHKISILNGADSNTFELIKYNNTIYYGKDSNRIYYVDRQKWLPVALENADPKTFQVHGPFLNWFYYATDNKNVWFYDNDTDELKVIPNSDPNNFDFLSHAKNYYY